MTQAQHEIALKLAEARMAILRGTPEGGPDYMLALELIGDAAEAAGREMVASMRNDTVKAHA